jgi:hypothetical protein
VPPAALRLQWLRGHARAFQVQRVGACSWLQLCAGSIPPSLPRAGVGRCLAAAARSAAGYLPV